MKVIYLDLFFFFVATTLCSAGLLDEIEALDKELGKERKRDYHPKSLRDMSTDELIEELKKEVKRAKEATKRVSNDEQKDSFDDFIEKYKVNKVQDDANFDNFVEKFKKEKQEKLYRRAMDEMFRTLDAKVLSDESESCKDVRDDCKDIKGMCKSHKLQMEKRCAKTCGFCYSCKNQLSNITCNTVVRNGFCESSDRKDREKFLKYCPESCGLCKAATPPLCSKSKYGCCWDLATSKTDKEGSKCPECKDEYQNVCEEFEEDCSNLGKPGLFMNRHCPAKCGRCSSTKCEDVHTTRAACPMWDQQLDWCRKKEDVMRFFCPKTCNFC